MQLATQPELVAKVLMNRSVLHVAGGDLPAARRDLDHCLELAQSMANGVLVAKAVHDLGFLDYVTGDLPVGAAPVRGGRAALRGLLPGILAMLGLDRGRALVAAGLVTEAERELLWPPWSSSENSAPTRTRPKGCWSARRRCSWTARPREARRLASTAHALLRRRDNQRWAARSLAHDRAGGPGRWSAYRRRGPG